MKRPMSPTAWREAAIALLTQRRDGVPGLDMAVATACVERMHPLNLPADAVLFNEGDGTASATPYMALLVKGEVRVARGAAKAGASSTGHTSIVNTSGPGTLLGEMSLLDPDAPPTMTCTADTDIVLAVMSSDDFQRWLRDSPYHAARLLQLLGQRLSQQNREMCRRLITLSHLSQAQAKELAATHAANRRLLAQLDQRQSK